MLSVLYYILCAVATFAKIALFVSSLLFFLSSSLVRASYIRVLYERKSAFIYKLNIVQKGKKFYV